MPLYLRPPRAGKTPYYYIRGTYLGVRCEESTGTGRREIAKRLLDKKRDEIERGAVAKPGEPTFAEAAIAYMTSGGERRFLAPLIEHFGTTALSAIDQLAIDNAAGALYPRATRPRAIGRSIRQYRRCSNAPALSARSSGPRAGAAKKASRGCSPSRPLLYSLRRMLAPSLDCSCGCSATRGCD